jgi:hypothetical protein
MLLAMSIFKMSKIHLTTLLLKCSMRHLVVYEDPLKHLTPPPAYTKPSVMLSL